MSGDKYFPLTSFAARIAGKAGWQFGELALTPEEAEESVRSEGQEVLEFRVVSEGLGRRWKDNGEPDVGGPQAWVFQSAGWYLDPVAKLWRAPDEMIDRPGFPASWVPRINVIDEPPDAGWWYVTLSTSGLSTQVNISRIYDPIDDLLAWLERIAKGVDARVLVDCEGRYRHFIAFSEKDGVRFIVDEHDSGHRRAIDVLIDRHALVVPFMRALRRLFDDPAYVAQWSSYGVDEGEPLPSYRMEATEVALRLAGYAV